MAVVVVILVDMVKKVRHPCIGIDSCKFAAIHHSCTSRWHSVSCLEIRWCPYCIIGYLHRGDTSWCESWTIGYELGRVGHEKDLLIYAFPVVEQEFCQIPLVVCVLSQDILHPCSGQHWQPCWCLCANIRLLYDKQMHHWHDGRSLGRRGEDVV